MKAWQSRIKKVNFKNLVSLINEFYKKWIASDFSNPRNDDYILSTNNKNNKNYAFSYAFNFEIISRNKNSKYAILSYGNEVKVKLTVGANKSKYELDDKYTFFNMVKLL